MLYVAVMAIPLVSLALLRRDPGIYGLTLPKLRRDLKVVAICIVPTIILSIALFFIDWKRWEGALLVSGIEILMLLALAKLMEDKSDKKVKAAILVNKEACMECGACFLNCPTEAIEVDSGVGCASAMIRAALTGSKEVTCDSGSVETDKPVNALDCEYSEK